MTKKVNMIYQGAKKIPVREIVIHCSATRPSWMANNSLEEQVAEIRDWHVTDRKWKDIGYHWVMGRNGMMLPGRPETVIGAGVEGHNSGVIHLCMIGGHGSIATGKFFDSFTVEQADSLLIAIANIGCRTQIQLVTGHNAYANKACPGFNVSSWIGKAGGLLAVLAGGVNRQTK